MKKDKIGLICIWYEPNEVIVNNWLNAFSYKFELIIVDNSKISNQQLITNNKIKYIYLNGNKGIAYAQNVGIKKAQSLGCEFIVFFDQDSLVTIDLIRGLYYDYNSILKTDPNIAAIGPRIVNSKTREQYKMGAINRSDFCKVKTIISSGTFTNSSIFNKIGMLDDKLFIDYVDHDWCWRINQFGYSIYISNKRELLHQVGECQKNIFRISVIISAPFRYYYKYRNYFWLLRRSYVPTHWKIKKGIRLCFESIVIPLLSQQKKSVLKYIWTGIKDGIK